MHSESGTKRKVFKYEGPYEASLAEQPTSKSVFLFELRSCRDDECMKRYSWDGGLKTRSINILHHSVVWSGGQPNNG